MLPLADAALALAQERLREQLGPEGRRLEVKPAAHARLSGLALHQDPLAREVCPGAGSVSAAHIDRLITVVSAGALSHGCWSILFAIN